MYHFFETYGNFENVIKSCLFEGIMIIFLNLTGFPNELWQKRRYKRSGQSPGNFGLFQRYLWVSFRHYHEL